MGVPWDSGLCFLSSVHVKVLMATLTVRGRTTKTRRKKIKKKEEQEEEEGIRNIFADVIRIVLCIMQRVDGCGK